MSTSTIATSSTIPTAPPLDASAKTTTTWAAEQPQPTTLGASHGGEVLGAKLGRACDSAAIAVTETVEKVATKATDLGRAASAKASEVKTEFNQGIKEVGHEMSETAVETGQEIKTMAAKAKDAVVGGATWAGEKVVEGAVAVKDFAVSTGHAVQEGTVSAGNKLNNKVNELVWSATAAYEKAAITQAARDGDLYQASVHEAKYVQAEVEVAKTKLKTTYDPSVQVNRSPPQQPPPLPPTSAAPSSSSSSTSSSSAPGAAATATYPDAGKLGAPPAASTSTRSPSPAATLAPSHTTPMTTASLTL